ncbi:MAG: OsmC family protein [Woeseiaceae bacterium]|nr:OsmC family protein [Woeseiaceae bacterium]|tara:strand:- start:203 stop:667 length:465 start_codon:yes stop_codon:yes gene_type:complete
MSETIATVSWERGDQDFCGNEYSRGHTWTFDGGLSVPASASPDIVPLPWSVAENLDPEEAFVASISSCHMLFFLSLAAKRKIVVDRYADSAVGFMEQREDGKIAMTKVILRPEARYFGDAQPSRELLEKLHHRAHELCFIANSVNAEIVTEVIA